jgi:hypothetical protein
MQWLRQKSECLTISNTYEVRSAKNWKNPVPGVGVREQTPVFYSNEPAQIFDIVTLAACLLLATSGLS